MNDTTQKANFTGPGYYELPLGAKATISLVEIVIALLGVLGNLLVVIVITKRANMKTTMNLYLRNLAIADLGVLCVIFPLTVSVNYTSEWLLGEFFCKYIYPVTDIFYGATIWSITVIAIERYRNIISRRSFGKKAESPKKVTLKIVAIWLISFLFIAVPMFPIMVYAVHPTNGRMCFPVWPSYLNFLMLKTYMALITLFLYIIPMVIIVITYSKISSQLKQSTMFHKGMHGEESKKSQLIREEEKRRLKQNKKAKRILTPLVLVFAITMLPFNIFRFVIAFFPGTMEHEYIYTYFSVCNFFLIINSAVDPLVYYISSKEFRKVLQPMLNCHQNSHRDESSKSTKASQTLPRTTNPDALLSQQNIAQSEM